MAQNRGIVDKDGKIVTVTTDGSKERLDVNAKLTSDIVSAEVIRYNPKFYASKTEISLSDTLDTVLANINFDGQLSGISINYDKSSIETILEVDATEILRINHDDLSSLSTYDLSTLPQTGFTLSVVSSGKHIYLDYKDSPADVLTNLTIKAKKMTAQTVNMKGIIVIYRKKVVS